MTIDKLSTAGDPIPKANGGVITTEYNELAILSGIMGQWFEKLPEIL